MKEKLAGKTILITGASYGIGEATANLLANFETTIILVARSEDKLHEIVQNIRNKGGKADGYKMDLKQPESIHTTMQTIVASHPVIDFFISNAGKSIRRSTKLSFNRFQDAERTMQVNYLGPVQLCLQLLPIMLANGGGHIINVSALSAKIFPSPRWGFYHASKIAFDKWLLSIAPEFRSENITITNVYLPLVKTRMIEPTPQYKNALAMTADDVANLIAYSLLTKKSRIAPWWLLPVEFFSILFHKPVSLLMAYYFKRTKDIAAAEQPKSGII